MFTANQESSIPPTLSNNDQVEEVIQKPNYFIITIIFFNSIAFHGVRSLLSIFAVLELKLTERQAKYIYHTFLMLSFLSYNLLIPILNKKYKIIICTSAISLFGIVILGLSSLNLNVILFIFGILLTAFGFGCLKLCVVYFGLQQFTLPKQEVNIILYLFLIFFTELLGAIVAIWVTPLLRNIEYGHEQYSYIFSFIFLGILMSLSITLFIIGEMKYKSKETKNNMLKLFFMCIGNAIKKKCKSKESKPHWLDHAIEKYQVDHVTNVKKCLKMSILFIPLPIFWALHCQQGSTWTFQAARMQRHIDSFIILPEQVQLLNPFLFLLFTSLFVYGIYPFVNKKSIRIMTTIGGTLCIIGFIFSQAITFMLIEGELPAVHSEDTSYLYFYNNLDCSLHFYFKQRNLTFTISKFNYKKFLLLVANHENFNHTVTGLCHKSEGTFTIQGGKNYGYFITNKSLTEFEENLNKDNLRLPHIRFLFNSVKNYKVQFMTIKGNIEIETNSSNQQSFMISKENVYKLKVGNKFTSKSITLDSGGIYRALIDVTSDTEMMVNIKEVRKPTNLHVIWLLPQYVLITLGEIFMAQAILLYAYQEAPFTMKIVMQSFWNITACIGNLIVIIYEASSTSITGGGIIAMDDGYMFYIALMLVNIILLRLLLNKYKNLK